MAEQTYRGTSRLSEPRGALPPNYTTRVNPETGKTIYYYSCRRCGSENQAPVSAKRKLCSECSYTLTTDQKKAWISE